MKISFTRVPILLETASHYYLPHASCLTVDAELELPKSVIRTKALVTLTSDPDCRFLYETVGLEVSSIPMRHPLRACSCSAHRRAHWKNSVPVPTTVLLKIAIHVILKDSM